MPSGMNPEFQSQAYELAEQILSFSRNTLFMNLRFMENALSRLTLKEYPNTIGTDGRMLYFNSEFILRKFQENATTITRMYLHSVLHCVFQHFYVSPSINIDLWDLSCDIAVEIMLRELGLTCVDNSLEAGQDAMIDYLKGNVKYLTAEKIYYFLLGQNLSESRIISMRAPFMLDDHFPWYNPVGSGNGNGDGNSYGEGDDDSDNNSGNYPPPMSYEESLQTWKKSLNKCKLTLKLFPNQEEIRQEISCRICRLFIVKSMITRNFSANSLFTAKS